jgi:hypothetical protein
MFLFYASATAVRAVLAHQSKAHAFVDGEGQVVEGGDAVSMGFCQPGAGYRYFVDWGFCLV